MNRDRFLQLHASLLKDAARIVEAKNKDYANEQDPLANFRAVERLGLMHAADGILTRLMDKIVRIIQWRRRGGGGFAVPDEGLRDTVIDAINYLAFFYAVCLADGEAELTDGNRPGETVA